MSYQRSHWYFPSPKLYFMIVPIVKIFKLRKTKSMETTFFKGLLKADCCNFSQKILIALSKQHLNKYHLSNFYWQMRTSFTVNHECFSTDHDTLLIFNTTYTSHFDKTLITIAFDIIVMENYFCRFEILKLTGSWGFFSRWEQWNF